MYPYYSIEGILHERLQICLKENTLNAYLFGLASYFLWSDPRDSGSDHAFTNTMIVYHQYSKSHPELKLPKRYVQEVIKQLKNSDYSAYYKVYESLNSQITIEEQGWASFYIPQSQMQEILALLEEGLEKYKRYLERFSYQKGKRYQNGVYEYIQTTKDRLYGHCRSV